MGDGHGGEEQERSERVEERHGHDGATDQLAGLQLWIDLAVRAWSIRRYRSGVQMTTMGGYLY
jgi:hypothetical protein